MVVVVATHAPYTGPFQARCCMYEGQPVWPDAALHVTAAAVGLVAPAVGINPFIQYQVVAPLL